MNTTIASTVLDPVCGMAIDPAHAAATSVYEGATFHFCANACKVKFDAAPATYAKSEEQVAGGCCGGHCATR